MHKALTGILKWLFLVLFIAAISAAFLAVRELGQNGTGSGVRERTLIP